MTTCQNCVYWSSNVVNNLGWCFNTKMKIVSIDVAMRNDGRDLLEDGISLVGASHVFFGADFGCVHWSAKKGSYPTNAIVDVIRFYKDTAGDNGTYRLAIEQFKRIMIDLVVAQEKKRR